MHLHIPKGYIYFAMGFSVFVEMINIRMRDKEIEPVSLRSAYKQPAMVLQPAGTTAKKAPAVKSKSKKKK